MNKSTALRVRIAPELKARLKKLAREDKRTLSDYVCLMLERGVRSVECFDELASVSSDAVMTSAGESAGVYIKQKENREQ